MGWTLVECGTSARLWSSRWRDTRSLDCHARSGSLLAYNAHGTLRLFDVSDHHAVTPCGELALPAFGVGLAEEYPLCFVGDRILQSSPSAIYEIDISRPDAPVIAVTHELTGQFRPGTFIDGILYASSFKEPGLFAIRGREHMRFADRRSQYSAPATFAKVGGFLYAIGSSTLDVFELDGGGVPSREPVVSKKIDTGGTATAYVCGDMLAVISWVSGFGVQIVDAAKAKNPKVQKRVFKPEPRGSGMAGETLLVVDGPYQKHLSLTRISLARPASEAGAPERLTDDPELACGLLFIEERGDELFVLANTGRFAVLART